MIISTPVSVSNVRIFRPSRPIIRPFISSLGKLTELIDTSEVTSDANLCIVVTIISRAFLSASFNASCSILFITTWASCFASFSIDCIMSFLASSVDKPATCSNSFFHLSSSSRRRTSLSLTRPSLSTSAFLWVSKSICLVSRFSSFCRSLLSVRWDSILLSRYSRSC